MGLTLEWASEFYSHMLKDRAQISTTRMLIQRHRVGPEYLNQQGSQGIDGLLKGPHFEKPELRKGTKESSCLPRGEVFFPVPIIPTIPYCPHTKDKYQLPVIIMLTSWCFLQNRTISLCLYQKWARKDRRANSSTELKIYKYLSIHFLSRNIANVFNM